MSLLLVRGGGGAAGLPDFVHVHASMPEVAVEIDFTNDPTSSVRNWQSLSDRLREIHLRVYRSRELDEFQVGTLTVVLANTDRALEPSYAGSAYYPNVVPRRPIRYRARWGGVTYERFSGFTRAHSIDWPGQVDAVTVIDAADHAFLLNRDQVTLNGYPEETADSRIGRVLDDIGVPAGTRSIDTSDTYVAAVAEVDVAAGQQETVVGALAHCQDCARADGGYLFVSRDGYIVFHNRYHRRDILGTSAGTFGDSTAEIPYRPDLAGYSDDGRLWNRAAVITADGVREEYTNTASASRYWASRRDDLQSVIARPGDAAARASLFVWRYSSSEPSLRFPTLKVQMLDRSGMDLAALLAADVGTRFTVARRPPGGGAPIGQEIYVEGISEDVAVGATWELGLDVSPVDPDLDVWVVGTSQLGVDTYNGQ